MSSKEQHFDKNLVSVILPLYNGESFIKKTLESIFNQTYQNLEIIVVDDGSTDKSADIVHYFQEKDKRITLICQANQGVAAARNTAIKHSQGEFIAPIDADDLWSPTKISKQVLRMRQAGSACGLVYTWSVKIDENEYVIDEDRTDTIEGLVYPALAFCNFVGNASVPLIRRECFDEIGYYNTQLVKQNAQGCEDWDLYFSIAEKYKYAVVPEFLMGYRMTLNNMSSNFDSMLKSYFLLSQDIEAKHPEIPRKIHRWSEAQFYAHFASQSLLRNNKVNFAKWWLKAVITDFSTLLNTRPIRALIKNLLLQQKKIQPNRQNFSNYHSPIKAENRIHFSLYPFVIKSRWREIKNICKSLSS